MGTAEGCVKDYLKSSTGLDNCKSYCGWVVGYFKSGSVLAISIFAAGLFLRHSLQKPSASGQFVHPNCFRPMFLRRPFQRIRPLKSIGPTTFVSNRSFAWEPTIEPRHSLGLSAKTCSMTARTSACRPESPVSCICTETAMPRENITVFPSTANPCHRTRILPQSHRSGV